MAKRVLITGCSSGIGRALAVELTTRGYEVIATARKLDALDGLQVAQRFALDVTSDTSVADAVTAAGRVDVLVNNAGVGLWGPVEAVEIDTAERLFETNVFGPMRLQKAVLPQMRERRSGVIVQVSSVAGRTAGPLIGHYSASKHALEAYSAALRIEVAGFGIKVANIELGAVESDFGRNRTMIDDAAYDAIIAHFKARLAGNRTSAATSEVTARGIADVIDAGAPDLYVQIDDVARGMIESRMALTPAQWEAGLLQGLDVDAKVNA
jgi:short-subunit dehydrogenase